MPIHHEYPQAPCYAVIFTSQRNDVDEPGYQAMAQQMQDLARQQAGYLGFESVRDATGKGISVSYWRDLASVRQWKQQLQHQQAQQLGKECWYQYYRIEVSRVERMHFFSS